MKDLMNFVSISGLISALVGAAIGQILIYFLKRKYPHMPMWKIAAIAIGIILIIAVPFFGHLYYKASRSDNIVYPPSRVEWRVEIRQDEEPETWPFKEPRYMLGCKGGLGDYWVYLVKVEDIMANPSRPANFEPQYYGLKGMGYGWKKGETQLAAGQSPSVFERYVSRSLNLCKEAEARKDSGGEAPKK